MVNGEFINEVPGDPVAHLDDKNVKVTARLIREPDKAAAVLKVLAEAHEVLKRADPENLLCFSLLIGFKDGTADGLCFGDSGAMEDLLDLALTRLDKVEERFEHELG